MKKRYIIIFLILFFFPLSALASLSDKPSATIAFEQKTFKECLSELNKIFSVEITLAGDLKDVSNDKLNITMEKVSLEQAIKEVVRKAGVQSHALILGEERKNVRVWILRAGGETKALENNDIPSRLFSDDDELLTQEQIYLLAQHHKGPSVEEDDNPLTPQQLLQIRKQSAAMEEKLQESMGPLTPEQSARLKEQSIKREMELEKSQQPLSAEQIKKLREQSARIEDRMRNDEKKLTQEQILLLQEEVNDLNQKRGGMLK